MKLVILAIAWGISQTALAHQDTTKKRPNVPATVGHSMEDFLPTFTSIPPFDGTIAIRTSENDRIYIESELREMENLTLEQWEAEHPCHCRSKK